MARQKTLKITLFARIMMSLILPLVALTLLFTALQLANEMRSLKDSYQVRSKFAFESVHRALQIAYQNLQGKDELSPMVPIISELKTIHYGIDITLFDLHERLPAKITDGEWSEFDNKATEASLYQKQQGVSYSARINKETRKLMAYIPIEGTKGDIRLVAKVTFPLANIREALAASRWSLIIMVFMIVLTGIAIGARLSGSIVKPIKVLSKATQEIVEGHLGKHVHINTGDEIQALAETFNSMSDALKDMKKKAQDSNPLTGLPGNQGIFHELKKRIHERQKFVLFHIDLDRFKVFNDHFGLAKGDECIVKTAELLREVCEKKGQKDDFVGHQGGDDFVLVTRPNRAEEMAKYITEVFDSRVLKVLYPAKDFEQGYTMQIDRRRLAETGEEIMAKFPLIAISLAGVSNAKKDFADYFDCMSSAVSAKKEVKKIIESCYVIKEDH
jgi:diguanylate cyclase (GGDEF)-like protein